MHLRILSLTFLVLAPWLALAAEWYTTTSDLNLRSGPGTNYPITFTLRKGAEVKRIYKEGQWYKVQYRQKTGFVNARYLEFSRTDNASNTQSSDPLDPASTVLLIVLGGLGLYAVYWYFTKEKNTGQPQKTRFNNDGLRAEEALVTALVQYGIPREDIFHNLYVPKSNGTYSQTDVVALTKIGMMVFEVKELSGWLFGSGNQSHWTQVLAYGKQKNSIYNPILQNRAHVVELEKALNPVEFIPTLSVIVFYGNCKLKNIQYIPQDTYLVMAPRLKEVLTKLEQTQKHYHFKNKPEVRRILQEAVDNGKLSAVQAQHRANVQNMLGTDRIYH